MCAMLSNLSPPLLFPLLFLVALADFPPPGNLAVAVWQCQPEFQPRPSIGGWGVGGVRVKLPLHFVFIGHWLTDVTRRM